MGTRDSRTISDTGRTELEHWLPSGQGDSPVSPTGKCPGGSGERGVAANSTVARGAVRDLAGSPRVDSVATIALRTWAESRRELPEAVGLWQPYRCSRHGCSTACAPRRRSSWLSGANTSAQPGKGDRGAGPCTPPARARGEAPPLPSSGSRWLAIGRWGAGPGTLLAAIHNHSTSQGGEGPLQGGTRLRGFFKAVRRHL